MLASHVTLEVKKPLGVMPGAVGADESRVDAVLFQQVSDQEVVVTEGLGTRGAEKGHRQVVLITLLHFLLSIATAGGQVWSLQYSNLSLFYRQGSYHYVCFKETRTLKEIQSRLESIDLDGILEPPHLALHTRRGPCFFIVVDAMHEKS